MYTDFFSLLADLLEKVGLAWWRKHKQEEVASDQNKILAMSDTDLDKRVLSDITKS